jgi:AraC-like DNA-binding protein
MAARANSLTKDAGRRAGPEWTMPATDIRVLVNGLKDLGYEVAPLLVAAGVNRADLANPDARIPCETYGRLLSQAMRERHTPNIALHLARQTPVGAYPLLDYLVLTSDSVSAGLHQLSRYVRLTGSPVAVEMRESARSLSADLVCPPGAESAVEYFAAVMILHLREETGGRFAASSVSFRHSPEDPSEFEQILGCPVQSNAASNNVTMDQAAARLPLGRRDSVLRRVLESQADEILARLPVRKGLAADVQRALSARVGGGPGSDIRVDSVARDLAVSARTLQRRLAAEGVSYQNLLDEARKEAAGRHLAESVFAIGEIAYLVGYSEPAPFYRAFKRWYGVTPEAFRQAQRS